MPHPGEFAVNDPSSASSARTPVCSPSDCAFTGEVLANAPLSDLQSLPPK